MHLRLIAVGERQPAWVDTAFDEYSVRLPKPWSFRCETIPAAKRGRNDRPGRARDRESETILARIAPAERVVLLDERGRQMTTRELAASLGDWQQAGRDVCLVIGGPDGVSAACRDRADTVWSLSALTLPHGLARVFVAEQLYRAWSLLSGHPYHRE